MKYFVTGTDTGVGKTYFSVWLLQSWKLAGHAPVGLKPISCGGRDDAKHLQAAGDPKLSLDEINPCSLSGVASPYVIARDSRKTIDLDGITAHANVILSRYSHGVVEGLGGWRVPITAKEGVREWVVRLKLPTILVAMNRLGMVNHTLLTLESMTAAGVSCPGIVVSDCAEPSLYDDSAGTNPGAIAELTGMPVFELRRGAKLTEKLPPWLL